MHTLRCALAEWQVVRVRVLRTRLGLWLLLLAAGFLWLGGRGPSRAPLELALRVGALSAVLSVAFGAGADTDRAALRLTLTHPTSPLAVAGGRWLAATGLATAVTAAVGVGTGVPLRAAVAGAGTAGATAGCALVLVWMGGNALGAALFFYMLLLSGLAPQGLGYLMDAGPLRAAIAGVLTVTPSLWRYRALASGDAGAWAHAVAWMAGGVLAGARLLRRQAP
jgi:hypothetical protein